MLQYLPFFIYVCFFSFNCFFLNFFDAGCILRSSQETPPRLFSSNSCPRRMPANTGGSFLLPTQRKKKNYIKRRRKEQISEEDTKTKYRRFTSFKYFLGGFFCLIILCRMSICLKPLPSFTGALLSMPQTSRSRPLWILQFSVS